MSIYKALFNTGLERMGCTLDGCVEWMVTRTLSTHDRSNNNVDVVSARSVLGLGLGWVIGAIGCFSCLTTQLTVHNHIYCHSILFVCPLDFCFYLTRSVGSGSVVGWWRYNTPFFCED